MLLTQITDDRPRNGYISTTSELVLALSGHDHNYQRLGPKRGVRYVVHGGGNSRLYPISSCPAGYPRRARGLAGRSLGLTPAGR